VQGKGAGRDRGGREEKGRRGGKGIDGREGRRRKMGSASTIFGLKVGLRERKGRKRGGREVTDFSGNLLVASRR